MSGAEWDASAQQAWGGACDHGCGCTQLLSDLHLCTDHSALPVLGAGEALSRWHAPSAQQPLALRACNVYYCPLS